MHWKQHSKQEEIQRHQSFPWIVSIQDAALPLPPGPLFPTQQPTKKFSLFIGQGERELDLQDTTLSHLCPNKLCIFPAGPLSCHSPSHPHPPKPAPSKSGV